VSECAKVGHWTRSLCVPYMMRMNCKVSGNLYFVVVLFSNC
jgi:hypothetical protein